MKKTKSGYKTVRRLFGEDIEIPKTWKVDKIQNHAKITTGSKNTQDKTDTGRFPFYVRSQKIEKINSYSYDGEAVLTVGDGKIGEIFHYVNGRFDFHQRVYKISDFDELLNGCFFYYYFKIFFFQRAKSMTAKNTVDSVRMDMITKMLIPLPSIPEQQKIASILSGVDATIESTQKVIEKAEKLKRGLMQRLLTKGIGHTKFKKVKWLFGKGIEIPEKWNIEKFKDISKINPKKIGKEYPNQDILYVDIGSIDRFQIVDYDIFVLADRPSRAQRIIEKNDVIVSTVRPYLKAFSKVKKDKSNMVCSTGFTVIGTKNKEDGELIFQFVQSKLFEMHMIREMEGLAYPAVTSKVVANSLIPYPIEKHERQKIASILSGVDAYIQKNQQYKERLEKLKKGLMQKLLTGQIRVKV